VSPAPSSTNQSQNREHERQGKLYGKPFLERRTLSRTGFQELRPIRFYEGSLYHLCDLYKGSQEKERSTSKEKILSTTYNELPPLPRASTVLKKAQNNFCTPSHMFHMHHISSLSSVAPSPRRRGGAGRFCMTTSPRTLAATDVYTWLAELQVLPHSMVTPRPIPAIFGDMPPSFETLENKVRRILRDYGKASGNRVNLLGIIVFPKKSTGWPQRRAAGQQA